jgi:hypothetical protein
MNNVKFAAMVGAVAASTLGVAASHCQSPVSVIPAVIVYHDSALRSGQSSPSSERFSGSATKIVNRPNHLIPFKF